LQQKAGMVMKLELFYDPIAPSCTVCVNGQVVDGGDIYGFLYPVRSCLLQTWLPSGASWPGLAHQVRELARGEETHLIFRGRRQDLEDVADTLAQAEQITLTFEEWDPIPLYEAVFDRLDPLLDTLLEPEGTGGRTLSHIFPDTGAAAQAIMAQSADWLIPIASEADLLAAARRPLTCCAVEGRYMDSYEKLDRLDVLTRSMRRSRDMICCVMDSGEQRDEFLSYARQYSPHTVRFAAPHEDWKSSLYEKYGVPFLLRQRLAAARQVLELLEELFSRREALSRRKRELALLPSPTEEEELELDHVTLRLNWFSRKESTFHELRRLLRELETASPQGKEAL